MSVLNKRIDGHVSAHPEEYTHSRPSLLHLIYIADDRGPDAHATTAPESLEEAPYEKGGDGACRSHTKRSNEEGWKREEEDGPSTVCK
jgi:hypothetical protein